MAFVAAADPASKVSYVFDNTGQLSTAIEDYHFIPIREDGSPFKVQKFEGGYLLDGAPINVWMGEGWFSGQQELLRPLWASGEIPTPPANVVAIPAVPMPTEVQQAYETYKAGASSVSGILGSIPTPVWIGLAAVVAWKFWRG
jgi:hypothetical protein